MQIKDLRDSNERLESFAYIASHDLRSPLRAIMSLAEWLGEDLQDHFGNLPEAIDKDLKEIRHQGERMECLLVDLLNYSRLQHSDAAIERFDTNSAVQACISLISPPDGFAVSVAPDLPPLRCSEVEFSIVLRNLISNAIKHHDRDTGTILVSGRTVDGMGEIEVSDDGPGFDPAIADDMFEMFRRFKSKDGNGIGLGMVRVITDRFGGTAKAHSVDGERGATFTVSFPVHPVHH